MRRFFWGLAVVWFAASAVPAAAHPHVWIDVKAEITISNGILEGVWATWTFDDMFSSLIMQDNDPSGAGKITASINASIQRSYFDYLRNYDYFSHFQVNSKTIPTPAPKKFRATISSGGRVTYHFFLPVKVRLDAKTIFHVSFYDDTFFTAMSFIKKQPIVITVTDGGSASYTFAPDKSKTYYGGSVTPIFALIRWSPQ